jgi:hypothetical protein
VVKLTGDGYTHTFDAAGGGHGEDLLRRFGVLIGLLAGVLLCARYLRQEMAANIGPKLEHIRV